MSFKRRKQRVKGKNLIEPTEQNPSQVSVAMDSRSQTYTQLQSVVAKGITPLPQLVNANVSFIKLHVPLIYSIFIKGGIG